MSDLTPEQLDKLIDIGNKALNDYYHDRACACSTWPDRCWTGEYFPGTWDTNAFAIALPAINAATRDLIAEDILNDQSDVPWMHSAGAPGGWIDRRDRTKALDIILNGPIKEQS